MIKTIYTFLVLGILVGCTSSQKKEVDTTATAQSDSIVSKSDANRQAVEMVANTAKGDEFTIQKLRAAFNTKDEVAFLQQFPSGIVHFRQYFGWNEIKDGPNPLYDESYAYIDYWFRLIGNKNYIKNEQNIVSLSQDAIWEPDAVNYFQDKSINYIKENQRYNLINDLDYGNAFSLLFFLFDGPHPKYDSDFAAQLNPEKKQLLIEVFETAFYDKEDVERGYEIEHEEVTFQRELSFYAANDSYFISDVDVNNDAILDKVVSSKPYEGDELLFFISKGDTYEFALKAINFSEDGGNIIRDIKQSKKGIVVTTYFPDGGFFEAHHYISSSVNTWVLTNTIYKTKSSNQEDAFTYVCDVKQGVDLGRPDFWNYVNSIPQESERAKVCLKQKHD